MSLRLREKVGLIFSSSSIRAIEELELASRRLELLQGLAIQDERKHAFGIRLEFLKRVEAALKSTVQVLRDSHPVRRRHLKIELHLVRRSVGDRLECA